MTQAAYRQPGKEQGGGMIETRTLDSGVRVVMEKMPRLESCTMGIWVRAGACNETKEISGISHFIEHMMFKGTGTRSAKQIAEDVDALGGQINAFTGKEATCYHIRSLSSNAEKSLEILLDMFTGSVFDKTEMEREKQVVIEEMKMVSDSPDDVAIDTACELVMKGTPLANDILGKPYVLKKITRNRILDYIDRQYTKDSIVFSISGNFDEDRMVAMFEEKTAGLRAKKKQASFRNVKHVPAFRSKVKDIEQAHICMSTRGVSNDDDRFAALQVLNNIMGGSMSSRLFQHVREQKGLAYTVFTLNSPHSKLGYYTIYAGVGRDNVRPAVEAIKEELKLLKNDGITEEELTKAKEQLKASYIFSNESAGQRMYVNGKNLLLEGRVYEPKEILEKIDAVQMEDIDRVKRIICDIDDYSAVLVSGRKTDMKKIMRG